MDKDLDKARKQIVAKSSKMVQEGKMNLSLTEAKALNYLISKIKPKKDAAGHIIDLTPEELKEAANTVFTFNCTEFQKLIHPSANNNNKLSYTYTKSVLNSIGKKTWWIQIPGPNGPIESMVHWLNVVHMDVNTNICSVKFHEDMVPYLYNLVSSKEHRYASIFELGSSLNLRGKYSLRIYELLKTYVINNKSWVFEYGTGTKHDLQMKIADWEGDPKNPGKNVSRIPKGWKTFAIFKRDVLDPAKEEINTYTDIKMDYIPIRTKDGKTYRSPVAIKFVMLPKTAGELQDVEDLIDEEYSVPDTPKQMTIEDMFFQKDADRRAKEAKKKQNEEKQKEREREEAAEKLADETAYPIFYMQFYKYFTPEEIDNLYRASVKTANRGRVDFEKFDPWCTDYASHYWDWIQMTKKDTKTTPYKRLLAAIVNDYDQIADKPSRWDRNDEEI